VQDVRRGVASLLLLVALAPRAGAQSLPFLPVGDSRLRSEIELNQDEGRVPLSTTWPIPSDDIPEQYRNTPRAGLQPGSADDAGWFMSAAVKPTVLRGFEDTPREEGEAGVQSGWAQGDYAGGVLRLAYDVAPRDGMKYRFDGSYASWKIGNWWATLGTQERWWGPGWDGSLILSSNARPMPGIALDRASALPPDWKWLRWIGPWRLTTFMDRLEDKRPDIDDALFFGMRVTFQPLQGLEIGLSRTAEWCGTGRPCGLGTFYDLLLAHQNALANNGKIAPTAKPGVQQSAIDFRWAILESGLAVYWQEYGQTFDSGNFRPRQTSQLIGLEYGAREWLGGRARTFLEFADTTCGDLSINSSDQPEFGCTYEKDIYRAGYRYRGEPIGDSMDRDGRRFTVGVLYLDEQSRSWLVKLRRIELNRGGIVEVALVPQPVSVVPEQIWNIEAQVSGRLAWHALNYALGTGVDRTFENDHHGLSGRVFLSLSKNW
jgi:hypothetical protein